MEFNAIYSDIKNQCLTEIDNPFKFLFYIKFFMNNKRRLMLNNDEILSFFLLNIDQIDTSYCQHLIEILYELSNGNIPSNFYTSRLMTSLLDDSNGIPIQLNEYICRIRMVNSSLDLLIENYSSVRSDYFYELLFKLENKINFDINQCFRRIISTLKEIDSKDMYFKHKFVIEDKEASITGLIFSKLSLFENVENQELSNGVYSLLRYISSIDINFTNEFSNFYTKKREDLEELTSPNNIGIFLD